MGDIIQFPVSKTIDPVFETGISSMVELTFTIPKYDYTIIDCTRETQVIENLLLDFFHDYTKSATAEFKRHREVLNDYAVMLRDL